MVYPFKAITYFFANTPRKIKSRIGSIAIGPLLGLFIFILIGVVLLPVITSEVSSLTTTSYSVYTTTSSTVTETLTSTIYPAVQGSSATLLQLVPLFYILVLIIVPAVMAYKLYKE
ncbi:VP1-like protein [Sulfolobales Mexican fusellovirus 1]|uniref:virion structural protein n=1 Tax=Sulfolobales Mexican fusellovirus 1 TaxID=1298531 RepID=UPI0002C091E1|nr:virion structural protein [Sulfolobales Mexican fusellovirus 1]AGG36570.1 VP1-like protein [Sulfolobales Mexican fusellovirus 1]